jgi:UDP-N-acetylmuramoyl-tripeptide--D-alanyl-D-alanine ligase
MQDARRNAGARDEGPLRRAPQDAHARRALTGLVLIGAVLCAGGCGPSADRATTGPLAVVWAAARGPAGEEPAAAPPDIRRQLDRSLALGRQFLLASQLPSGVFRYQVDLRTGEVAAQQNPVRQAGALWGLALIHRQQPTPQTRAGVVRGAEFFAAQSRCTPDGRRFVRFPGYEQGDSGTVALVALALREYVQAEPSAADVWRTQLDEYLAFLQRLERPDHRFHRAYLHTTGEGWGAPSPYFDGEILLALARAAVEREDRELRSLVLRAAEAADAAYVRDAVAQQRDDDDAKGFFQWGCLAYALLSDSRWPGTEVYGQRTIALGHWMIDVHQVAQRRGNTAYACEGLVVAHQVALAQGDRAAAEKFRGVIEDVLRRLLTWQVGSDLPNPFLRGQPGVHPSCLGGVLTSAENPWLRIDTTQHQMHAVMLARRSIWP